ncbi:MAG: tRNA (adenosine(37)-N6)-threonylcarbamoyltransferase complex dimerization subunit type 1 TsaB [Gammaproteobacteria bacterium]|nr:tRNA (adenosine(37)-N6)-threonylcarbamoyltransferase complex dimerization subunit type 1 TsaB [Gammaproteobacteria bacterium]
MKVLAIETSTEACSAAVWVDGDVISRQEVAPQRHAALLLGQVDEVLGEAGLTIAELDRLGFARGPGSFTGVRIATSVIQGLAYGASIPVAPISTLLVLAEGMRRLHGVDAVVPALDARRGEVYIGGFRHDGTRWSSVFDESVSPPTRSHTGNFEALDTSTWVGVGSGWASYPDELTTALSAFGAFEIKTGYPDAIDVAVLAATMPSASTVTAAEALPVYLRDEVVIKR